jgi:L-ascorbate metabolism protein UlaG (beta-lactamase superfamily)
MGEFMIDTKGNTVTYLAHSAFLLTTASGSVGIIDPFLQNPNCPKEFKKLEKLDVIFLSHAHGDHLGDTVELARKHNAAIACMFETSLWLNEKCLENETKPMGKGGTQKIGEFAVTMTHAMHSNSIEDGKHVVYAGEPAGLVIRMPGGFSVYHAGDTCLFGDMKLIGELYKPDVALLPIGDHFTMGPREAAMAVKFLGVKHVVPMHYATFPVLTGTPEEFQKECAGIAGVTVHVMKPGESLGGGAAAAGGRGK